MSIGHPTSKVPGVCPRCDSRIMLPNTRWMVAVRRRSRLTLREIAKRIGISIQYLSDQERGHRRVQSETFAVYKAIAKEKP